MNVRRLIQTLYLAAFVGLAATGAALYLDARAEYRRLLSVGDEDQRKLAEAQAHLAREELILERLRKDPAYVERVIRERLGYAKPDEAVFRFEE